MLYKYLYAQRRLRQTFIMIRGVWFATVLLCVFWINSAEAITVCHACTAAQTIAECTSAQSIFCGQQEICYVSVSTSSPGGPLQYNLGCMPETQCPNSGSNPAIIGRRQSNTVCTECCLGSNCNNKSCEQAHGRWSLWSSWGACSVTCGVGLQRRDRNCSNPYPSPDGNHCFGDSRDDRACVEKACTDGGWSAWSDWGECSTTCDTGLQKRTRSCDNPSPSLLGRGCVGNSEEVMLCKLAVCLDGGWSAWSDWGECSTTCDTGLQKRTRSCDNPSPSLLGRGCVGNSEEVMLCKLAVCLDPSNPSDCKDVQQWHIGSTSGVYMIRPVSQVHAIQVYCDMETDSGGWTVFQRRFNGSVDFYRTFKEYENGFGDLRGELWLGLRYIQDMTSQGTSELRIDVEASDGSTAYQTYQNFSLSGANYTLHIGQSAGTAGDTNGLAHNNGQPFSTYEQDNDGHNCSLTYHGGWWYGWCTDVNLNGHYATPGTESHYYSGEGGVTYYNFKQWQSLKSTKMMFRRN